jgi:hypothetical protein
MFLCPQVLRTRFQDAFLRRLGGLEPLPDAWDLISAPRRIASARADLRRHSFSPLPPAGAALRPLSLSPCGLKKALALSLTLISSAPFFQPVRERASGGSRGELQEEVLREGGDARP